MDYFDIDTSNFVFKEFAVAFGYGGRKIELGQFSRINDSTISWNTTAYGVSTLPSPNIFIKMMLDEQAPYFELTVKFQHSLHCRKKFKTVEGAIEYVNAAIDTCVKTRNKYDSIWEQYGF